MKKKLLLLILIAIIIITIITIIVVKTKKEENINIKYFNMEDYKDEIEKFSSDKVLGYIKNEDDAKAKAKSVWISIYGEDAINKELKKQTLDILYSNNDEYILVKGNFTTTFFDELFYVMQCGGVPNIIIQKSDGKVIAVWHTQ